MKQEPFRKMHAHAAAKHHCANCGEDAMWIADTRPSKEPFVKKRRRYICNSCGYRETTIEVTLGGPRDAKAVLEQLFGDVVRRRKSFDKPGGA